MTVLVITGPLLAVAQHVVSFLHFLELGFSITGLVNVRVILARQLTVGLLYFIVRCISSETQHLIKIAFICHCFHLRTSVLNSPVTC
ncbi:hypothetical protein D3C80_1281090 [compost metagenome]